MNRVMIPKELLDGMVAHCAQGYPNEACGILAGKGDAVSRIYAMVNTERSPVSYFMDPSEQFRVMKDMRERGLSMVAIFHSHPSSAAYPSSKDVSLAFYEDSVYVIVSLGETEPVVRGFSIREGTIREVAIEVKDTL